MKNPKQLSMNSCCAGHSSRRVLSAALSFISVVFLFAGLTMAQTNSSDSPLLPWIGVWTITNSQSAKAGTAQNSTVEIRPTADRKGLEISRKTPNQPDVSETLIPDGTRRPINAQNCTGWHTARWIPEAGLIHESSEMTCKDTGSLTTSALKMILATDQMAEALLIKAAGQPRVAVRRLTYDHDLPPVPDLPPAWVATSARTALSASWTLDKIIQLSKEVDAPLLEAAMIEKKVKPSLDSQSLKQMQAAKLPKELIDLTVALAYPTQFHIEKNGQVELRPWLDSSKSSSTATAYAPLSGLSSYPGTFYNCYSPMGYYGYRGISLLTPGSCWSYYSPFWWDYPFYVPPVVYGTNPPANGSGGGIPVENTGGFANVAPIPRHARPRGDSFPSTGGFGTGSSSQSGGYGAYSAGGGGYGGGSSGGSSASPGGSGAPSASPGGYSSGGGGGGTAVPR
jgi:hypothetical protein